MLFDIKLIECIWEKKLSVMVIINDIPEGKQRVS